jgi:hypothetical protein
VRLLNYRLSARFLSNAGALGLSQAALVLVLGLDGGGFTQGLLGVLTWCSWLGLCGRWPGCCMLQGSCHLELEIRRGVCD